MKKLAKWRLIFILVTLVAWGITNLSNQQKATIYNLLNRTFSETSTQQNVALQVLSIQETEHTYDEDKIYLIEYQPNEYVFLEANEQNEVLQDLLTQTQNKSAIAVKVISKYMPGTKGITEQFHFTKTDIPGLPQEVYDHLLYSRVVSLTQYEGLRFYWIIVLGAVASVITVIISIFQAYKRRKV